MSDDRIKILSVISLRLGAHTSMAFCQTKLELINALVPFSEVVVNEL